MNTAGVIAKTAIVQSRLSRNDMYKVALGLRSIVSKSSRFIPNSPHKSNSLCANLDSNCTATKLFLCLNKISTQTREDLIKQSQLLVNQAAILAEFQFIW